MAGSNDGPDDVFGPEAELENRSVFWPVVAVVVWLVALIVGPIVFGLNEPQPLTPRPSVRAS